jgi:acyl-CoA thioester hydrolase
MHKKVDLADLQNLPITNQQEIPEEYRDAFGHMNVMWYTRLFGYSFDKFGSQFGFNIAYCRANQIGHFVLETHIRYLSEVRVGQHITIRSRALGRTEKRIHYIHFMTIDETGALASTAEHVSAHIDMHVRRMSPIPAEFCARYDELVARQNQLSWDPPVCGSMKP